MKTLELFGTLNNAPATRDALTIEKVNQSIRELRVRFPEEFEAARLWAKYERLLFGPIPFKFPTNW
jgi:hypothetical protein